MQLQLASAVESITFTTQLSALGARLHQQDEQFTEWLSLFDTKASSRPLPVAMGAVAGLAQGHADSYDSEDSSS